MCCLFLAFTASNCKDKPENRYDHVRQELKDWGVFKVGTWWVYEEEILKIRDSVYIYREEINANSKVDRPNQFSEEIGSYLISTNIGDTMFFRVITQSTGVKLQTLRDYPEYQSACYLVVPPPVRGGWSRIGPPEQITIYDTIYAVYKLGTLGFSNVVRANDNMNLAFDGTPTLIYTAKNIGIVRKEFPEFNQVWNLVAYSIVQ